MGHELTDDEWAAIRPMTANEARGVPWVNDVPMCIAETFRRVRRYTR